MQRSAARGLECLVAATLLLSVPAEAQEGELDPPRKEFALPVEIDFDYGANNGAAIINRYSPLFSVPLGTTWRLINLSLVTVADAPGGVPGSPGNPEPVPGAPVFGLGDVTDAVFFTPPTHSEKFVWGFGPGISIPAATNAALGSGKWSAGPAFRFAYRPGRWNLGALVVNLGSFAGNPERGNVHQLLVRPLVRRQLGDDGWYFSYSPIITANWNASSAQRWLVPIGGGIGKAVTVGSRTIAVAVHYYYNAIKPAGAPVGLVRIDFVLPIPVGIPQ